MRIIFVSIVAISLVAVYLNQINANNQEENIDKIEWWKKTNFYHIYLRSFKDSNGDGNGDLRGVIEKLDYLKMIGVETILMAPFYSSPMKDCGYDIDDYKAILPMFGTMTDFEDLVKATKEKSLRFVVDFVPNHSSDKHEWFKCSERALLEPVRCGKYKDYYVWVNSTRYNGQYPSNWISVFGGGPAWQWSPIRNEFYLHQFLPEQPDLNFSNPLVREEFKDIARFWLRKGVDGLRVDSAIYLIEDTINFADEPENPNWRQGDDPADRLLHVSTRALHESAVIVKDWQDVANEPEFGGGKVIITEAYDAIPKLIEYYGPSPDEPYADMPFNFELFRLKETNLAPDFIEEVLMSWIRPTLELKWPDANGAMAPWICWVTGNHDNKRVTNRLGYLNAPVFKWISYLAPGVPVNYYGDELGMHDANFNAISQKTIDEGEPTRLPFRAPIAWNDESPSGGFSTSSDIWLPLNDDYKTNNVKSSLISLDKTHLKLFLKLQQLRSENMNLFVFGDLVFFKSSNGKSPIFAMARTHQKHGNILLLANFDMNNSAPVHLQENQSIIKGSKIEPPESGDLFLLNHVDSATQSHLIEHSRVKLDGLVLGPLQAVLIKY